MQLKNNKCFSAERKFEKKTKKLQRVIMLVLALVLAFNLGGCGKPKEEAETNDGTTVIKWYAMGTKQTDHDVVLEEFNKVLKEKYNMKLDLQLFNSADYGNKIRRQTENAAYFLQGQKRQSALRNRYGGLYA